MTLNELWSAYISLGGSASPLEMETYVFGTTEPIRKQHDILAQALNERFMDLGLDHPTPYLGTG
jgi:hypothetical protein